MIMSQKHMSWGYLVLALVLVVESVLIPSSRASAASPAVSPVSAAQISDLDPLLPSEVLAQLSAPLGAVRRGMEPIPGKAR
jgi:hypothetical protein